MKPPSSTSVALALLVALPIPDAASGLALVDRRTFWGRLGAGGSAAAAASFLPAPARAAFDPYTFNHSYDDPKHPGCKRIVAVKKEGVAMVAGQAGKPACSEDFDGEVWRMTGMADGDKINIDFTDAGGPEDYEGTWDGDGIKWSDGQKWYVQGKAPKSEA